MPVNLKSSNPACIAPARGVDYVLQQNLESGFPDPTQGPGYMEEGLGFVHSRVSRMITWAKNFTLRHSTHKIQFSMSIDPQLPIYLIGVRLLAPTSIHEAARGKTSCPFALGCELSFLSFVKIECSYPGRTTPQEPALEKILKPSGICRKSDRGDVNPCLQVRSAWKLSCVANILHPPSRLRNMQCVEHPFTGRNKLKKRP